MDKYLATVRKRTRSRASYIPSAMQRMNKCESTVYRISDGASGSETTGVIEEAVLLVVESIFVVDDEVEDGIGGDGPS